MACKNDQCKCRFFCEVKSDEVIDKRECEEHRIIASWWHDKVSGLRDRDPEEDDGE